MVGCQAPPLLRDQFRPSYAIASLVEVLPAALSDRLNWYRAGDSASLTALSSATLSGVLPRTVARILVRREATSPIFRAAARRAVAAGPVSLGLRKAGGVASTASPRGLAAGCWAGGRRLWYR